MLQESWFSVGSVVSGSNFGIVLLFLLVGRTCFIVPGN